jgi:HD superfamily phosphodiesterase
MLEKIRELSRKEAGNEDYNIHVKVVVKYTLHLAKLKGVDPELAELAALLHDIALFRYGVKGHDAKGADDAAEILKQFNYPQDKIDRIHHAIECHSGNKDPTTMLARVLRDADALSHFDAIPWLLKVGLKDNNNDLHKAIAYVDKKIDNDIDHKMTLDESKLMVKAKYGLAKQLLKFSLDCFKEN